MERMPEYAAERVQIVTHFDYYEHKLKTSSPGSS
jgi:hypothetical protein